MLWWLIQIYIRFKVLSSIIFKSKLERVPNRAKKVGFSVYKECRNREISTKTTYYDIFMGVYIWSHLISELNQSQKKFISKITQKIKVHCYETAQLCIIFVPKFWRTDHFYTYFLIRMSNVFILLMYMTLGGFDSFSIACR